MTRSWDSGGPFRRDRARPAADALRPKLAAILASSSELRPRRGRAGHRGPGHQGRRPAPGWSWPPIAEQSDKTRSLALKALDQLDDPRRIDAAQRALILPGSRSRTEALRVLAKVDPAAAMAPIQDRLEHGSAAEQQGAIAVLAAMPGDRGQADALRLARPVDRRPGSPRAPARPDRGRRQTQRPRAPPQASAVRKVQAQGRPLGPVP